MADGSIVIDTVIDSKTAERQLSKLNSKIQSLEDKIYSKKAQQLPLIEESNQLAASLDEAKRKLDEMQNGGDFYTSASIKEQQAYVNQLQKEWDAVQKKVEKYCSDIATAEIDLERNSDRAAELSEQLEAASDGASGLADGTNSAQIAMDKFTKKIMGLAKRVFIFSLITMALRNLRSYLDSVFKSNDEFSASLARLKGAALTAAQPLLNVLIPALTTLLQLLTAIIGRIASVISALFGSTIKQSAQAAESLNDEANAIKGVGGAAKKASRSLASFDELNILASESGDAAGGVSGLEVAPEFTWMDNMSDNLKKIADAVLLIGAGFALWKIASSLPGSLGMLATTLGSILVTVGGLILLWQGLKDAWENGIDWVNAAMMVGGLAVAAFGLYKMLGEVGLGIALVVGGLALLITGFKDAIENGWNLQNTLVSIAGIIATGLGITLLTGNLIPFLVAGIGSILLAITVLAGNGEQLIGNLKQAFGGLKDFIVGVLTGDIEKALEGLKNFAKGIFNSILTVFGSIVNLIIRGLNWLIGKINSIKFDVPDWVPIIGGKSLSPRIPTVKEWAIPQLAQGAVIPPNKAFMAVLGDQKSGTNIEAPLDTIKQALSEVIGQYGGGGVIVEVYLDSERVTNKIVKKINNKSRASGQTVLV